MRVKTGFVRRRKHKKILTANKGYYGSRSKLYRKAHESFIHAGEYAFAGRKDRKSNFRRLWIQRINAALTPFDLKYSVFIDKLKKAKMDLNRKTLADLALNQPQAFSEIVKHVR